MAFLDSIHPISPLIEKIFGELNAITASHFGEPQSAIAPFCCWKTHIDVRWPSPAGLGLKPTGYFLAPRQEGVGDWNHPRAQRHGTLIDIGVVNQVLSCTI